MKRKVTEIVLSLFFVLLTAVGGGLTKKESCETCSGAGTVSCTYCGGSGKRSCYMCFGAMSTSCISCAGMGYTYQYDLFS